MAIFTAQMTQLFASLVSTLQQPHHASVPKRHPAHTLEGDVIEQEHLAENLANIASKRWDNKTTPNKQLQMFSENDNSVWQTPDSTPRQKSHTRGDQNITLGSKENHSLVSSNDDEDNMSRSEDVDIMMHDSGNESKPKSLTSVLEAEASGQENGDRK